MLKKIALIIGCIISIAIMILLASQAMAGEFGSIREPNVLYVNYSGCRGTSYTSAGTGNSIFLVAAGTMATSYDGIYLQGPAWSPSLSFLITDNNSHTVATKATNNVPWLAWDLVYNGSSTGCIVRLMSTTNKSNFPAIPIAAP